tara:strand:+ start:5218 stop:5682 length:465 start_codon:yes stop_codon:yes gene_type:complete
MKKIAAILDTLAASQNSFYLIKEFNKLHKNYEYSPVCFYNNLSATPVKTFFACMNVSYYSYFDGVTIATSIETADTILKTKNRSEKKFLYLWDLEWIRGSMDFNYVNSVLSDPNLAIISRSNSHKQLIENYCNKEVSGIVQDWNMEQLEEIIWT